MHVVVEKVGWTSNEAELSPHSRFTAALKTLSTTSTKLTRSSTDTKHGQSIGFIHFISLKSFRILPF